MRNSKYVDLHGEERVAYPGKRHDRGETLHLGRSSLERGELGNI